MATAAGGARGDEASHSRARPRCEEEEQGHEARRSDVGEVELQVDGMRSTVCTRHAGDRRRAAARLATDDGASAANDRGRVSVD